MNKFDLGIRSDFLLALKGGKTDVLQDAFIGIRQGRIAEVGAYQDQAAACQTFIHAERELVMPGLINAHTHLPMVLFRGLADDLPFLEWLHQNILPMEARLVSPEFNRIGARLAAAECIRQGITTICDMYFFEDVIADELDRAGMRGFFAECVNDFPTPDDRERKGEGYRILDRMRAQYSGHARIHTSIGPHAPYTCSDETLVKARRYANEHGLLLQIHVAETRAEVDESLRLHGKSPVQRLSDLGILDGPTLFAHGVHLSDEDIAIVAQAQVGVIHNPESNLKLSAGVARIPALLKAGVRLGLGTDGSASNNDLGLFKEMDLGAKVQKWVAGDNTAVTAKDMLRMATWGGAQAIGLGTEIGSLEVGKRADLITVSLREPHMVPLHDPASLLVYSANGSEVQTVICEGQILMRDRVMKTLDLEATVQAARDYPFNDSRPKP